jgi:uncharacterized protein YjdB
MKSSIKLLLIAVTLMICIAFTGCGGQGGSSSSSSPLSPTVTAVSVGAVTSSLSVGGTLQLTATATYSDKSTKDVTSSATWESSDATIATVSSTGLLSALKPGNFTVTSMVAGTTGTMAFAVKAPTLSSILIAPASTNLFPGQSWQMKATGVFTDGAAQDVTSQVSWTSGNQQVASVASGLVTATGTGQTSITATSGSATATATVVVSSAVLSSIVVTPANVSIATGQTMQFAANGIFSDGSTSDITNNVVWDTSNHAVSTMSQAGLATGVGVGTANVTATVGAVVGSLPMNVTAAVLQSIDIDPDDLTVPLGAQVQFTVTGTFSDSTTQQLTNATFTSSDPSTAKIDPVTGVATGVAANSTAVTITATVGSFTDTSSLTVTAAALQSLTISPGATSIPKGTTQLFSVNGNFSDGSTQPIVQGLTWSSQDPTIAGIDETGLASAVGVGNTNIEVSYGGLTASVPFTGTAATPVSIIITPGVPSVGVGGTEQFTASGLFTDQSVQDLTSQVQWLSSNAAVALVSGSGLANTISMGTTQISATYMNVSGSTTLTVAACTITGINVVPATPTVPINSSIQFSAVGVYNGNCSNAPVRGVWWRTSSGRVARIYFNGLARTRNPGTVTVSAWLHGMTGSTTMTVTNSTITSMRILPYTPTIAPGTTQQFTLTGTYGDGATVNLTNSVYWETSNWKDAVIWDGLAYGRNPGQVTVTAKYKSLSAQQTLTVSNATVVSISVSAPNQAIAAGATEQLTATAKFSDGTTQDVTALARWTSSNPSVAIASWWSGLVYSASSGSATISATFDGATGTTDLTVN